MTDKPAQRAAEAPDAGLMLEIPLARSFRERTGFASAFAADLRSVRRLSGLISKDRGPDGRAGRSAALLNALALIEEILRHLVSLYVERANPGLLDNLAAWLEPEASAWDAVVRNHVRALPPLEVYAAGPAEEAEAAYIGGASAGVPNRRLELLQVIMLWLAARNPAYRPYAELFDDAELDRETGYRDRVARLRPFFEGQPHFGPDDQNLLDLLAAPALASPDSLFGQLEYIRLRWAGLLGRFLDRLLRGEDMLREEEKQRGGGPGPSRVLDYRDLGEQERYSPDRDWMPSLVMMAKSTLVWLDQLSRAYRRPIRRLDEIPEEEIARLSSWGISGLWLIGIWERSAASRTIKRSCGNPEAESSAYSLRAYRVADSLGGPEALASLAARCRRQGIRLASDMVPNHTGMDSPWLTEHPDWYINLPEPPFSGYSFRSQDLSEDPRFGVILEDHYYDRSDAAVVFRLDDRRDGAVRYVYHGNDGTHLPWNDTAQLNYLDPELREAVIRTILEVARQFPIIRFDAAMTLTRRHYQRLWFPPPGSGGDIPSRSAHGLSREEFDSAMPEEFWRQVVDRVAAEAPDTLLLAEAFWLMEGYFVRTLGMHRVYNSAFMNMLKMEENRDYRALIKNTLRFDPRILARYVNFMNNPDEETAVAQFGKGDKYFGVCVLLATLPGLPMIGHGQVEGLEEKYGMEYARAYRDEEPDGELVRRHEREIFPLLARRALFAGVEHFRLYDLAAPGGRVDENVLAFSNRDGRESALVLVNNRYAEARGRIHLSAEFAVSGASGGGLRRETLYAGLGLPAAGGGYVLFRELICGLEYIRAADELREHGLGVELGAYRYQVLVDFRRVADDEGGRFAGLAAHLGGRGTPDLEGEMAELRLRPLHRELAALLAARRAKPGAGPLPGRLVAEAERDAARCRERAGELLPPPGRGRHPLLARLAEAAPPEAAPPEAAPPEAAPPEAAPPEALLPVLLPALLLLASLLDGSPQPQGEAAAALRLEGVLTGAWRESGLSGEEALRRWLLLTTLLDFSRRLAAGPVRLRELLDHPGARRFLDVHTYREVLYFRREPFEALLAEFSRLEELLGGKALLEPAVAVCLSEAERAGYRLDGLLEGLDE